MKKIITIITCLFFVVKVNAQIEQPVKWGYASKLTNKSMAIVLLKATIEPGWHVYSAFQKDGGPVKTSFVFEKSRDYILSGTIVEPKPITRFENSFDMDVKFFEHEVIFQQRLFLKSAKAIVKGKLTYMVCNDHKCLPREDVAFSIPVN